MRLDKIIKNFNQAASSYHQLAGTQREICLELVDRLSENYRPHSILDIGTGTGLLVERLRERFPGVKIVVTDIAPKMLEVFSKRFPDIKGFVADGRKLLIEEKFDLITCSSSLQWMLPIKETLKSWQRLLLPGGRMLIACMLEGTLGELKSLRHKLFPELDYPTDLPTWEILENAVNEAGLEFVWKNELEIREYHENAEAFIRHLKNIGVNSSNKVIENQITSEQLKLLIAEYDKSFYLKERSQVYASYKVALLEAKN